ncbi:MAG: metallophosphoesterase [Terracidiphilus sp.]
MMRSLDPRQGDVEDDGSSTKRRSLLSLAGSLLVEVSLPKLAIAWLMLIVVPALVLGLAPLVVSAWVHQVSSTITSPLNRIWPFLILSVLVAIGWFGGRTLFRLAESGFWSMNSLIVEPGYVTCREVLRHIVEALFSSRTTSAQFARLRAASAAAAGFVVSGLAVLVLILGWPMSRWVVDISIFNFPYRLVWIALANSVVLGAAYLAVAALVWAIEDTTMAQPHDLDGFGVSPDEGRIWRIAHLSDIHVVGERYGFRIESGRSGPRGNQRLREAMAQLDMLCSKDPLDAVLITGDMTDAGRSAEWAEFLDILKSYPKLAERVLVIPGNHDLNIVDRANPARLDTPSSPKKRLRKVRTLSAMGELQGRRVHIVDLEKRCIGENLAEAIEPYLADMEGFSDVARPRIFNALAELWARIFPMVLPPDRSDGLGIILLNSNADTHFSFTNALGMIPMEQFRGIEIAVAQYPQASWIVALHHHIVEYPRATKALSDRIGTALINGNWFVRQLRPLADRAIVMHGHRHVDWIGECGGLVIVSAPSPVMEATDDLGTYFYIQTLTKLADGRLKLLAPQRITLNGQRSAG